MGVDDWSGGGVVMGIEWSERNREYRATRECAEGCSNMCQDASQGEGGAERGAGGEVDADDDLGAVREGWVVK